MNTLNIQVIVANNGTVEETNNLNWSGTGTTWITLTLSPNGVATLGAVSAIFVVATTQVRVTTHSSGNVQNSLIVNKMCLLDGVYTSVQIQNPSSSRSCTFKIVYIE